jgi:branched-chain amino acid transport system substrate-binding protein
MKRAIFALGLAAVTAGLSIVSVPAARAADEVVLGYAMAKSGPFASTGLSSEVAVDLAVQEINAAGGVLGKRIRLVKFDTAGQPEQAVVAIRRFARDVNALAVVGPFLSSECRVAFPVGEREGIAMMSSASSAPGLTEGFTFAFRNTMDESIKIGRLIASLKTKGMLGKNAAVAYATDDFVSKSVGADTFPQVFKAAAIPQTATVTFTFGAFDLSPQVSQLMANPSDIVGVAAPPESAAKLIREMRRQGHKGRVIGGSIFVTPEFPGRVGEAGDGTLATVTFFSEHAEPRVQKFVKDFMALAKERKLPEVLPPSQFDSASYDVVYVYAEAMRRAQVTGDAAKVAQERKAVRDEIAKLKDFPALEGQLTMGPKGDMQKGVYVIEAQGGAWKLVEVVR